MSKHTATLHRLIREAVNTREPSKVGRISEHMRFDLRMGYNEQFRQVALACPNLTLADWDALLYEADEASEP